MKYLVLFLMTLSLNLFAAETAFTVTSLSETVAAISYESVDTTNGNSASNPNGDLFLLLYNASGADAATVTITAQSTTKTVAGWGTLAKSDNVITMALGTRKMVGPFRKTAWNDSSGNVIITTTGDASGSVDVAALRVPAE